MFHVGAGISSSVYNVTVANSDRSIQRQGLSLALGVDLFSPKWLAEVTFANYGEYIADTYGTSLKEFDMKVIYKHPITNNLIWRMGAGLAARYLNLVQNNSTVDFTTPSSILLTGIEFKVTNTISLVSEFGFRNPIITETPEKTAFDLLFRLDGHM